MSAALAYRLARAGGLFAVAAGVVLALTAGGDRAAAQKDADPGKPAEPAKFVGVAQCIGCHSFENAEKNPGARLYVAAGSTKFVRLNENITWSEHDLHSRAFQNIDPAINATAKQMQENLARVRPAGYKVTEDASCLACHATSKNPAEPVAKRTKDSFDTIQGVSCEMCHGHASNWLAPHAQIKPGGKPPNAWREWPATVKTAWGLTDLRDPAVLAQTCASCHVGSQAEGRFVTHEMFAAGHPPLPPFDSAAYTRDQPRHWGLPRELAVLTTTAKEQPEAAWERFHYRTESGENGEVYAARHLAEATVAAFRASVRLTGQLAAGDLGLDFAAFDCTSCHHNLVYPSARQKRGYVGIPGRPTFRPGPAAIARVVVRHAAGGKGDALKELDALEKELAAAFQTHTLGDPEKVRAACTKLDAWCAAALKTIGAERYTRAKAVELLRAVVAAGRDDAEQVADPETAQLIVWTAVTLRNELKDTGGAEPGGVAGLLGELDGLVVTRLRADPLAMKKAKVPDPLGSGTTLDETPVPVEDRLPERMKVFNGFDPPKFRAVFKKLTPLAGEWK